MSAQIPDEITRLVVAALPDARVQVTAHGGGHFSLDVRSAAFAGKGTLARHRLVLSAIKGLMAGDAAPVHAVDALVTEPE